MCLIVGSFIKYNTAKGRRPRIAKEDIKVFKYLRVVRDYKNPKIEIYVAPFQHVEYKLNKKYSIARFGRTYTLDSYTNEVVFSINQGFHAYRNIPSMNSYSYSYLDTKVLFHAIIPKGSRYFISEHGAEIVANQLIILNKVK